jgi:MoxR-like ATPase
MMPINRIPLPPKGGSLNIQLDSDGGLTDQVHLATELEISAINAAIGAGRPLLVRGEPGTGKSQLARAAAKTLGRAFIQQVIDSRSESRDLLWTFDAVSRLADAQLAGALKQNEFVREAQSLRVENYLSPGPLWWAFDWADALEQAARIGAVPPQQPDGGKWENGCVLLLEEIDKAESELPNGLLEALGARQFIPLGRRRPVVPALGMALPLVVITSNEERTLPDAFVRRCLVLRLAMPSKEELISRGCAHFPQAGQEVLRQAAELLFKDRESAIKAQIRPWPGQAEYLDMLRAVLALEPKNLKKQLELLQGVSRFTLQKYVGIETFE